MLVGKITAFLKHVSKTPIAHPALRASLQGSHAYGLCEYLALVHENLMHERTMFYGAAIFIKKTKL